jgi:hypothetical protein
MILEDVSEFNHEREIFKVGPGGYAFCKVIGQLVDENNNLIAMVCEYTHKFGYMEGQTERFPCKTGYGTWMKLDSFYLDFLYPEMKNYEIRKFTLEEKKIAFLEGRLQIHEIYPDKNPYEDNDVLKYEFIKGMKEQIRKEKFIKSMKESIAKEEKGN